jgi:hypothetical protein
MYDKVKPTIVPSTSTIRDNQHTFFTLTGRYEPFRKRLLEKLIEHNLHQHGLLTVQNTPDCDQLYNDLGDCVTVEPRPPYGNRLIASHAPMAAQLLKENIWTSFNTQNFLYIEQNYLQYPLTIIPETSVYNYFATEKSVWPALLGKLFLIVGSVGCMKYIQRFYDIDMSEFLNLRFDDMRVDNNQQLDLKLDCMIESNKDFILNSHDFYAQHRQRIDTARNTIGPNLYQFLLNQVAQIQ